MKQLDQAVINREEKVTREECYSALKKDLTLAGMLIADVLRSHEALDAVVGVMYARYEQMYDERNASQLPIDVKVSPTVIKHES